MEIFIFIVVIKSVLVIKVIEKLSNSGPLSSLFILNILANESNITILSVTYLSLRGTNMLGQSPWRLNIYKFVQNGCLQWPIREKALMRIYTIFPSFSFISGHKKIFWLLPFIKYFIWGHMWSSIKYVRIIS